MYLPRLLTTASLLFVLFTGLSSCEKDDKDDDQRKFNMYGIKMTGAQIKPVGSPSGAMGDMDVLYDRRTRILTYTATWQGLSDSVIAIRLNGMAPTGYNSINPSFTGANPTSFTTTPYVVVQSVTGTAPKALYGPSGTYTASIVVDGVKIKEQDVLNGYYYVTIHTKTFLPVPAPGNLLYRWFGEIRGQATPY